MATLTIGMPVCNGERTIEQALRSILSSRFQDFVLVISDNASDDRTWEIISHWRARDNRVVTYHHSRRVTASENFRFVLDMAETELFSWAASDDIWDESWFQLLVEASKSSGYMAFGTLRQITFAGALAPHHPADLACFALSEGRTARRLRFALADLRLGKANLIYSLGPTKVFRNIDFSIFGKFAGDVRSILTILDSSPIVHVKETYFYKRLPETQNRLDSVPRNLFLGATWRAWELVRPGLYIRSVLPMMSVLEQAFFLLGATTIWLPSRIALVCRLFRRKFLFLAT